MTLALQFGVPVWVAPLVAPAVDLSILGLLLGTRHLALHGATSVELRSARLLLIFASLATLALNIADPIVTGAYGKAAFDAVGPLLLIGWASSRAGIPPVDQRDWRPERSRRLVASVRSEAQAEANRVADHLDGASKNYIAQAT